MKEINDYGSGALRETAKFIRDKTYCFWLMRDRELLKIAGFDSYEAFLDAQINDFDHVSDQAKHQIKTVIRLNNEDIDNNPLHRIRLYNSIQTRKN